MIILRDPAPQPPIRVELTPQEARDLIAFIDLYLDENAICCAAGFSLNRLVAPSNAAVATAHRLRSNLAPFVK